MGSSGTRGVMSVLASFAAHGRSLAKGPDEARDHGGGRVLRLGVASPRWESLLWQRDIEGKRSV
jgi:hypothetical protein